VSKRSLKELLTRVEVEQDFCKLRYGETNDAGVCDAVLGETGDRKCYNTRNTCQDIANFNPDGRAGLVDGDGYFGTGLVNTPDLSGDFTLDLLMRLDTTASRAVIFWISGTNNLTIKWRDDHNIEISIAGSAFFATTGLDVRLSRIYHVLIERSGNTVTIEIDGEQIESLTDAALDAAVGGQVDERVRTHRATDSGESFDGAISEVRLWNALLSEDKKASIRHAEVESDATDLLHYWKFRRDSTNTDAADDLTGTLDMQATLGGASFAKGLLPRLLLKFSMHDQTLEDQHIPAIVGLSTAPAELGPRPAL